MDEIYQTLRRFKSDKLFADSKSNQGFAGRFGKMTSKIKLTDPLGYLCSFTSSCNRISNREDLSHMV